MTQKEGMEVGGDGWLAQCENKGRQYSYSGVKNTLSLYVCIDS